ncbi:MAG: class E sortase [Acidimicrobiia bacterium]
MAKFDIKNVVHKPDIRGSISLFGRALITLGLVLLLFVAYQLWGTNVFENRSQNKLRDQFKTKLDKTKKGNVSTTTTVPTSTTKPGDVPTVETDAATLAQLKQDVKRGEPIAIIQIPKIGLNHVVISGTDTQSLRKGPGHYPATPLPGQFGNSAIAGHRTTYGAPFNRLDELTIGDKIVFETVRGTFTYIVDKENIIVSPSDVSVIAPTVDPSDPSGQKFLPTLTLTTCHPKYSAAKRLVIRAKLDESNSPKPSVAAQLFDKSGKVPRNIDLGDSDTGNSSNGVGHSNILVAMMLASFHLPLLWWLLLFVTVGCTWWYFYKKFHNWRVWIIGALPFAVAMLFFFFHLEKALPSNL